MNALRAALVTAGIVDPERAQHADQHSRQRDARRRARAHRDLASRNQDAQMSDEDIADELLRAARSKK